MSITLLLIIILILILVFPAFPYNRSWGYGPAGGIVVILVIVLLVLLLSGRSFGQPVMYDCLRFEGKPDLGMSDDVALVYEWQLTLRDEAATLPAGEKASAYTIEPASVRAEVGTVRDAKFIVIDIERFGSWRADTIAMEYLALARSAAPRAKVTWWNVAPGDARVISQPTYRAWWEGAFSNRAPLVKQCDFATVPLYFDARDEAEGFAWWHRRYAPNIDEARRLYGRKPLLVVLCPHYPPYDRHPWKHVSGELFGQVIDWLATETSVDGIVPWSVETPRQQWDESWPWVAALRDRVGPKGVYKPSPVFAHPMEVNAAAETRIAAFAELPFEPTPMPPQPVDDED